MGDPFATPPVDPFNGVSKAATQSTKPDMPCIDILSQNQKPASSSAANLNIPTADPFATSSDPFGTSDDVPDPFGDDPFAAAPMPSSGQTATSQNTSDPWGSAFGDSDGTFVNSNSTATF